MLYEYVMMTHWENKLLLTACPGYGEGEEPDATGGGVRLKFIERIREVARWSDTVGSSEIRFTSSLKL